MEQQGLQNPSSWNQPKTWIVPLKFTVMVDDATKYDTQMETMLTRVLNELRSILTNFDKSGALKVEFGSVIKDSSKFEVLNSSAMLLNAPTGLLTNLVEEIVDQVLKKKKL
jgi:hypothetical protein